MTAIGFIVVGTCLAAMKIMKPCSGGALMTRELQLDLKLRGWNPDVRLAAQVAP
jgi:hypothetical protein